MKRLVALLLCLFAAASINAAPIGVLNMEGYGTGTPVRIDAKRCRGDFGEKEAVKSGDVLLQINGFGYDGTGFATSPSLSIKFIATEDWSTTAHGARIAFETTADGGTTTAETTSMGSDGSLTVSGTMTTEGIRVETPTNYTIGIGTTITPTSSFGEVVSTAAVAMSWEATPAIATTTATNGQRFLVMSSTTTDITINDNDEVAGTLIELASGQTTRTLSNPGDMIMFRYCDGVWYEEYFVVH